MLIDISCCVVAGHAPTRLHLRRYAPLPSIWPRCSTYFTSNEASFLSSCPVKWGVQAASPERRITSSPAPPGVEYQMNKNCVSESQMTNWVGFAIWAYSLVIFLCRCCCDFNRIQLSKGFMINNDCPPPRSTNPIHFAALSNFPVIIQ